VKANFVNIFGGITRVDEVANGSWRRCHASIFQRLSCCDSTGRTPSKAARSWRRTSSDSLITTTMLDAARRVVSLANAKGRDMSYFRRREHQGDCSRTHRGPGPISRTAQPRLRAKVVGGVTPGKGGGDVDGVPVFNTVKRPWPRPGHRSFVVVPPKFASAAILEAAEGGSPSSSASPRASRQDEAITYNRLVRTFPGCDCSVQLPGHHQSRQMQIGITSGDIALAGGPVGIVSRSGT